ncbi:hypothetical protein [Aneurinibacillus sp. REN35]|uniref:hypothetical protein n=1 Tax=Aneurinibacillus sp. REN35 TaxID=3237286 RepID=UPI003529CC69
MVTYRYNTDRLLIEEKDNEKDKEFVFTVLDVDTILPGLRRVRAFFDSDKVYTDVIFYSHPNHEYQVIVRHDHYIDFLLALFKSRIIDSLEWK